jgi:2-amino-4-hydroxy-6-hydroxymethyldihydropteridine diphosphokinase
MPRVFVGVGSNINRETNIRSGLRALRDLFGDLRVSTIYQTAAVGFEGDDFYNLVVSFDSEEPIRRVAAMLREIEFAHGRRPVETRYSSRTLDLDLLLYGTEIVHETGLNVPREDITRYDFVLGPLVELAPDLCHPETGERLAQLWKAREESAAAMHRVDMAELD